MVNKLFCVATILFVLCSKAPAAWTDCVCNIQGQEYGGSGVLVAVSPDRHGLIISAAHVFEDGNTHDLTCEFPALKKKLPARLLAAQKLGDIAALDITNAPDVELPPAIVAGKKSDGPFTCCGFPYDSRHALRWTKGNFCGYESGYTLLTFQYVKSGYSGGGRFNKYGEYVGPISGMQGDGNGQMTKCWGASGDVLLKFVAKYVRAMK